MSDNLYLIGYRGTGKSVVSEILSIKTGKELVHMDDELIKEIGDLGVFVKTRSWDKFRDKETNLLKKLSLQNNLIVDCGGGIIVREENIELIKKSGAAVFLKASPAAIKKRLIRDKKNLGKRPSITGKPVIVEIEEVLSTRLKSYQAAASIEIDTGNIAPEQVANKILWELIVLPRLAVCINEETIKKTIEKMNSVQRYAKLLEIRIDHINDIDEKNLKKIMQARKVRIIITNRSKDEGGKFIGDEKTRIALLKKAIELGADYVDIELYSRSVPALVNMKGKTKIICSYHNFEKIPEDIEELYEQMKKTKADIIKIACNGSDSRDNLRLFSLREKAKKEKVNVLPIIMGQNGRMSRAMNMLSDTEIIGYAAANDGKKTAPGQMTLDEMKQIFLKVR